MSLGRLARHYGVRIGIVVAILIALILLGPSIINYVSAASPLIKWLVNVVLPSLIIYLAP